MGDRWSRPHRVPRRTPGELSRHPARARRAERRAARHRLGARGRGIDVHAVLHGTADRGSSQELREQEIVATSEQRAGELVHVDCKKLGRDPARPPRHRRSPRRARAPRAGSACTWRSTTTPGSASPVSTPTRGADSALAFLDALVHSTPLTGSPWSGCSLTTAPASSAVGPKPVRARSPYRRVLPPQTNGKAERFNRTLLERWAYAYPYQHETERLAALAEGLRRGTHRRHGRATRPPGRRRARARRRRDDDARRLVPRGTQPLAAGQAQVASSSPCGSRSRPRTRPT